MIQEYILLGALLAISFDIWNQVKSMRIQSSLLTMNNQVNDFSTEQRRMKKVDEIYLQQSLDHLTIQNDTVNRIPEDTNEISKTQLKSVEQITSGLSDAINLQKNVNDLATKIGRKTTIGEYNRGIVANNVEIDQDLADIKQLYSNLTSDLEAVKQENQNLFEIIDTMKEYFSTDISKSEDQLKDMQMRLTIDD
tara:strand:- start:3423 stop:4004 length:582 start_codon:yes stop_codon:yes gene_type:complete